MNALNLPPVDELVQRRVLIITAQSSLAQSIQAVMSNTPGQSYSFQVLRSGEQGIINVYQQRPDMVILDSALPDIAGVQIGRLIKADPLVRHIPTIIITHHDPDDYVRMSELSLVADAFVQVEKLAEEIPTLLHQLVHVFHGVTQQEKTQLNLVEHNAEGPSALVRATELLDSVLVENDIMTRFRQMMDLISNRGILTHMAFSLLDHVLDFELAGLFFNDKSKEARHVYFYAKRHTQVEEALVGKLCKKAIDDLQSKLNDPNVFDYTSHELLNTEIEPNATPVKPKECQVFPFFLGRELLGALILCNKKWVDYDHIFPFNLITKELSALMRLRRYYSQAQFLSITDSLTQLSSFSHFSYQLEREIKAARRHKAHLTLAHISLDEFRTINTQMGHEMGDQALKHVASIALSTFRTIDILARASGRRIVILMPNTDGESAMIAVKRLQRQLAKHPLHWQEHSLSLTFTAAVTELQPDMVNAADMIEFTQQELDNVRKKGRNHIELIQ